MSKQNIKADRQRSNVNAATSTQQQQCSNVDAAMATQQQQWRCIIVDMATAMRQQGRDNARTSTKAMSRKGRELNSPQILCC